MISGEVGFYSRLGNYLRAFAPRDPAEVPVAAERRIKGVSGLHHSEQFYEYKYSW
jgi:hypothetical protein